MSSYLVNLTRAYRAPKCPKYRCGTAPDISGDRHIYGSRHFWLWRLLAPPFDPRVFRLAARRLHSTICPIYPPSSVSHIEYRSYKHFAACEPRMECLNKREIQELDSSHTHACHAVECPRSNAIIYIVRRMSEKVTFIMYNYI